MKGVRNFALTILLFCSSILAWELIVRAFEVPTFIFPAPSKVAIALWRGFASGLYQKHRELSRDVHIEVHALDQHAESRARPHELRNDRPD